MANKKERRLLKEKLWRDDMKRWIRNDWPISRDPEVFSLRTIQILKRSLESARRNMRACRLGKKDYIRRHAILSKRQEAFNVALKEALIHYGMEVVDHPFTPRGMFRWLR